MGHELYSALSGAFGALRRMDIVANNLANVTTSGFKRERIAMEATGPDGAYARVADGMYDPRDGTTRSTGNPLDVALQGPGFLVVQDRVAGRGTLLTRDGELRLEPRTGVLQTSTGAALLGTQGPIAVPPGESVRIDEDGRVWASETGLLDQLRVEDAAVEPLGDNLWRPLGPSRDIPPKLVPGALEQSNVQATVSMVELIEASRTFEMLQNVMRTSDQLDDRLNDFTRGVR